jgi:hypothetical protein
LCARTRVPVLALQLSASYSQLLLFTGGPLFDMKWRKGDLLFDDFVSRRLLRLFVCLCLAISVSFSVGLKARLETILSQDGCRDKAQVLRGDRQSDVLANKMKNESDETPQVKGWILDLAFWMNFDELSSNENVTFTIPYLNTPSPNFTDILESTKATFLSTNKAVHEQHTAQTVFAAAFHKQGFEVVCTVEQMQKISSRDQVLLYWGNVESFQLNADGPFAPRELKLSAKEKDDWYFAFGRASVDQLQKYAWVEQGGANLIYMASFPGNWPFRQWNFMKSEFLVTENKILPLRNTHNKHEVALDGKIHIIPYALRRQKRFDLEENDRKTFVMMRCGANPAGLMGIRLRYAIIQALQNAFPSKKTDIAFEWSDSENAQKEGHQGYQQRMQDSRYCIVASGDTLASLRLIDSIANGCVPVFIGPPFHPAFLTELYDWDKLAVFFYVHDQPWVAHPSDTDRDQLYKEKWNLPKAWVQSVRNLSEIPARLIEYDQHYYRFLKKHVDEAALELTLEYDPSSYPEFEVPQYAQRLAVELFESHKRRTVKSISTTSTE